MKHFFATLFLFFILLNWGKVYAQDVETSDDSTSTESPKKKTTDKRPRNAAIRSAIIPGWGQIYNGKKSYWKVPVIYGAGAAITWFLIDNNNTYILNRDIVKADPNNGIARINRDNFRTYR